jgi:predicted metalloprotease with PDZ domain
MPATSVLLLIAALPALAVQPAISYSLELDAADLSVLNVTMHVRNAPETFHVAMARHPEYDDRFWRYVEGLQVDAAAGPASVTTLDQNLWQVSAPGGEATLRYRIRLPASGHTARAAWRPFLTSTGGLIGDLHTFLYMVEEPHAPSHVMLRLPAGWKVATALAPTSDPNINFAASGDVLAESPILAGQLRDWHFMVNETPYRVSYWPLPDASAFDGGTFVAGIEKLVREAVALFGAAPWREYSFLLQDGALGALEHPDSLTLGVPSATLAGNPYAFHEQIAHEFVHAWNLMRIHPAEYHGIDYHAAKPSAGLWFSEGLSMFYADLLPRRAGLPTETPTRAAHLEELIARYLAEPGDARFSAEQVSRAANDARPGALGDYSASTHLQGELLGTMLDLIIRNATANRRSMDDVMRAMLDRFSGTRGFTGRDIENIVAELCGCSVTSFFDAYVRGAAPIKFNRYLDLAGLHMDAVWQKSDTPDLSSWAWMDPGDNTLRIAIADPASVWGRAGLHTGDQILGVNGVTLKSAAEFRDTVRRLHVGDIVAIEVKHSGAIRTATVALTSLERPKVRISELAHVTERQRAVLNQWR